MIKIKKGLNIPIKGGANHQLETAPAVQHVALVGADYLGMKPTMEIEVGSRVKKGQLLFSDKKMPAVKYTSPAAGTVEAIHRGDKRALISVVIRVEGDEQIPFASFPETKLDSLDRDSVRQLLIDSGFWVALRARPFGHTANPETTPHSIFITAIDTNPLAPSIKILLNSRNKDFANGLLVLSKLTAGKIYVCHGADSSLPIVSAANIEFVEFSGPHPAGLPGTHIHFLDPVDRHKTVWHIGLQDVLAIGKLFTTGLIDTERIIALAGPAVNHPRHLKTRLGASLLELTSGQIAPGDNRIVSGSVLSGLAAFPENGFLGRYHEQVSVIAEGGDRHFLGWLSPGFNLFSVKNIVASKLFPHKQFSFTTATNGGPRAIIPIGSYEAIMPLDVLPTPLLKSLAITDVEEAEKLGCLELVEEDLSLCTFVCPSKIDHGKNLRNTLTSIEKEG
ncbi:MAG: Na(+)-translocating NADH-quinone reductase subunit A [Calditrichaeota bacterium]|nr:MAG: Na(+)-translocating NADH-quinone reductase subunit A [Calditrichota bacterium]